MFNNVFKKLECKYKFLFVLLFCASNDMGMTTRPKAMMIQNHKTHTQKRKNTNKCEESKKKSASPLPWP